MLTGTELATAITAVLIAAIMLGWVLHWIWMRLANAGSDTARLTEMINRLHEADRARQAAEGARELAENLLAAREAEMETRLAAMQSRLDDLVHDRDAEIAPVLREARADAEASMAGLRAARRRIAELEAEVDALRRGEDI